MSPNLKPLILPQLVERRRKLDIQQVVASEDDTVERIIYYQQPSSSSSDIASPSPVTPTFSRSGHSRCSGSTSSLEQSPPSLADSPASPTQPAHNPSKSSISQLPDVQEDPLREEEDTTIIADGDEPYSCFCNTPCEHHDPDIDDSAMQFFGRDYDYDVDFFSDSDLTSRVSRSRKKRNGSESPFSGWGKQIGAKLPILPRWRSTSRRGNPTFSPASEPALDHRPSLSRTTSRAASSRSSSISAIGRRILDRTQEPPLPPTPALSLYESTEDIVPPALDIEKANTVREIERDRAMATTPLLPPLLTENPDTFVTTLPQPSPLQSPTVASWPIAETLAHPAYTTPPLSNKPSTSSFRQNSSMTMSAVTAPVTENPSPIPNLIAYDSWSDCLGHANFTISPKPYQPCSHNIETLSQLRDDWDRARVNYTKHLVRTGEHYGITSKTYALTQQKWGTIELEWQSIEDRLIEDIVNENGRGFGNSMGGADDALRASATLRRPSGQDELATPAAIPKMLEAEDKFPQRGDVDIVGPMQRDAVMVRDGALLTDDKRNVGTWFKTFAEKVGLRK